MEGFSKRTRVGLIDWVGDPNCQTAHEAILEVLKGVTSSFAPTTKAVTKNCKGNLGEFISFCIGRSDDFATCRPFPSNAFNPLSNISKPEIDIVWIFFGKKDVDDFAVLQEVKTTGDPSLTLAYSLMEDYDKLFGTDPAFTLHTRLHAIKNEIEYKLGLPDLCPRLSTMAGNSPQTSRKIRVSPTIVYERRNSKPIPRMLAVRTVLVGKGWRPEAVESWAIGFFDLDNRLTRLAMGKK